MRRRRLATLLFLVALLLTGPRATAAESEAPEGGRLSDLQVEVSELRGLDFLSPVKSEERTLEEAGQEVRAMLRRDLAVPSTRVREAFLQALGLLPEGAALEDLLGRLLSEQVRGVYDSHRRVFLVVRESATDPVAAGLPVNLGLDLTELYTVHELEHALQDQHFGLLEKERLSGDRFDRVMALQALVEGDANMVMFESAARRLGLDQAMLVDLLGAGLVGSIPELEGFPEFKEAPRFLREYLTMPYSAGVGFVANLRQAGGWARVDAAFGGLPTSTEHILHPQKFLEGGDAPLQVDLSGLPQEFGTRLLQGEDTAGEFLIRVWGEEHLGTEAGRRAAGGWGGDSWRVYGAGPDSFIVWVTAWDTEADAREFEALDRKAGAAREGRVERQDTRVLVLLDVPAELAEPVLRAAWKAKIES